MFIGLHLLVSSLLIQGCSRSGSGNAITTILVIRHAEYPSDASEDPPLNEIGHQRARQLRHALEETRIDAVYGTQFQRTRHTVEPTAASHGLTVTQFDADEIDQLVATILADHAGQVVLVCGHQGTAPAVASVLGAEPIGRVSFSDHDNLFVITISESGDTRIVHLQYGDPAG